MKTDLSKLNNKQIEAVVSDSKRTLVLAGAGSGKTKTLLQKILYLIEEKGVNPANILAITFTKNAANEMLDRLIIAAAPAIAIPQTSVCQLKRLTAMSGLGINNTQNAADQPPILNTTNMSRCSGNK